MKRMIALLCLMFVFGCSRLPAPNVVPEIQNIYDASVSVLGKNYKSIGAGTIIYNHRGKYMVVLTAAHVVEYMYKTHKKVYISYGSDDIREMIIYRFNEKYDLALLISTSREKENGPYVEIAKQNGQIGQSIWAIGSPLGEERTVTHGKISNRVFLKGKLLYRIDAPVFFGNSGGGLFSEDGKLIGVMHAINIVKLNILSIIVEPGAGFAIPLETILAFL